MRGKIGNFIILTFFPLLFLLYLLLYQHLLFD
nr:MAG TPA: hypothetical protein [Caudoviricetes sp.]